LSQDILLSIPPPHGKLVVGDLGELMVEFESETQVSDLSQDLSQNFKDQVLIAP